MFGFLMYVFYPSTYTHTPWGLKPMKKLKPDDIERTPQR